LAYFFLERLLDQSRRKAADAAGRISNDDMHGPIGKRVGARNMRGDRKYGRSSGKLKKMSAEERH
jgi:hypothetical protein